MRMLHTSDWHLGRSLHRADLRPAQAAYLDHLVSIVRSEKIDAVLVAGDVYDRAIPPVDAVELCEDALVRLRDAGARVVVISGNHDSARRLGFGSALVDAAGVYLRTRAGSVAQPVMLGDRHGPVAVYGVPYLEPDAVRADLPPEPGSEDAEASPPRPRARGRARPRRPVHPRRHRRAGRRPLGGRWRTPGSPGERRATPNGTSPSAASAGSRRPCSTASATSRSGTCTASRRSSPRLRYSGSPLPYSFSEARHAKGSWLVELDSGGAVRVERVPAPAFRALSVLRTTLTDLLTSAAYERYTGDFLAVTLTDTARPEGAMEKLRQRFPHVLVLAFEPDGGAEDHRSYRAKVTGRDDLTVAAEFVAHVRHRPVTPGERALLTAAFEDARRAATGEPPPAPGPGAAGPRAADPAEGPGEDA